VFRTNNTEKMTILGDGKVGIGTTPNQQMDVNGGSYFGIQRSTSDALFSNGTNIMNIVSPTKITNVSTATTPETALRLIRAGSVGVKFNPSADIQIGSYNTNLSAGSSLNFRLGNGNVQIPDVNIMTMFGNGNVGIGTTNPQRRLEITDGTAGNSGLRFTNLPNTSTSIANTTNKVLSVNSTGDVILVDDKQGNSLSTGPANGNFWSLGGNSGTNPSTNFLGTTDNQRLVFRTNNTEKMTILGDGSLGLGTTSPSNRLDIQSTTFGQSGVRLRNLPNTAAVSPNLSNRVLSVDASGNIILVNDCGCNPSGGGIPNAAPMQSLSQNQETQNSNSISYSAIDYQAKISKLEEAIKEQQTQIDELKSGKTSSLKIYTNDDSELLKKENETLKNKVNSLESKFDLLEKTLMNICESGCAGLENITPKESQEIDILYQSIPNPTDDVAMINYYLAKNYQDAFIQISDLNGRIIEKITLNPKHGNGSIKVSLGKYAAQNYMYYLIIEEKIVDSKKMTIIR
jgi:hypothetical protein